MDNTRVVCAIIPGRKCKVMASNAILHNFRMNHGLSIEYENSDQEMPVELAETDSIGNGVLISETRKN